MRGSAWVAVALVAALAGCGSEDDGPEPAPPAPQHILETTGDPGEPVALTHTAEAGDLVQVVVKPLPLTSCGNEKLVLEGPDETPTDLTTLDPVTRIEADGDWTWTFEPCPGDSATYTLAGTPLRPFALEADGAPVTLERHATYEDAATFAVPRQGRSILLGSPRIVLDPAGQRLVFAPGSDRLVLEGATQAGTYTVLGGGEFRLTRPVEVTAELDTLVELEPPDGREVGEYDVSFSVSDDTWLTAPLRGWAADEGDIAIRSVEAADGSTDGTRVGGGLDGLWHLAEGDYVARVLPSRAGSTGTITLTPLEPTEITEPGDYTLSTGAGGEPTVALYDLPGTHRISVLGHRGQTEPWALTWAADAEPEPCSSAVDCASSRPAQIPTTVPVPPTISGEGFLALAAGDGARHTVTVRIR